MKPTDFMFRRIVISKAVFHLLCYVALQTVSAQDFEPGYIVLKTNDTIYGSVKDRNNFGLFDKIRFKNKQGKVKRYRAEKLLGYTAGIYTFESHWFAEESNFFRFRYYSRPGYGEQVFLKVLHKGPLSCYAKEFTDDDNDFPNQFELFLREGETTMERATQGIFGLKKKRLIAYFWDCPTLGEKINNSSITNPLDVVEYYNTFCTNR